MGILNLLQHKEAGVATPSAKNTAFFIAEEKQGAGENEILAERPAIKVAAGTFFPVLTGDSRAILGTAEPSKAVTEETAAASETGITPSATKQALVWVAINGKAEATVFKVEVGGKIVGEIKKTPVLNEICPIGTFYVPAGKLIKLTKTSGAIEKGLFSVQLMN